MEGQIPQVMMVIVEPGKANLVLAELYDAKFKVTSVAPTFFSDLLIVFETVPESEEAGATALYWLEDTLGSMCKVY